MIKFPISLKTPLNLLHLNLYLSAYIPLLLQKMSCQPYLRQKSSAFAHMHVRYFKNDKDLLIGI